MTIKNFKTKLKLTIAVGLVIYSASLLKSFDNQVNYNKLSKNDKQLVDSLKRAGIDEDELRENVEIMGDINETLERVDKMVKNEKDFEEDIKNSFPEEFHFRKSMRTSNFRNEIARCLDKLNKINPKIFKNKEEIRMRLLQAEQELNKL